MIFRSHVNDKISDTFNETIGVPQGSVLGPIICLIFLMTC